MKEVTVRAWCDGCGAEIAETGGDVEPAVAEVTVALDGGTARLLDLCERHRKALVEPLALLLAESGQDVDRTAQRLPRPAARAGMKPAHPDRFPCLLCPEAFGSGGGLSAHYVRAHGLKDGTAGAVYGLACPACGRRSPNAPAMGMHAKTHGSDTVAGLFRDAAAAGDPHGIVKARRDALLKPTPRKRATARKRA
jgi:hypothetical protein